MKPVLRFSWSPASLSFAFILADLPKILHFGNRSVIQPAGSDRVCETVSTAKLLGCFINCRRNCACLLYNVPLDQLAVGLWGTAYLVRSPFFWDLLPRRQKSETTACISSFADWMDR